MTGTGSVLLSSSDKKTRSTATSNAGKFVAAFSLSMTPIASSSSARRGCSAKSLARTRPRDAALRVSVADVSGPSGWAPSGTGTRSFFSGTASLVRCARFALAARSGELFIGSGCGGSGVSVW